MKFSDKGIMAYSGTIRGAIAFGLACSLELENELHRSVIISGTLALVLLTVIIFGAFMPLFISTMKSYDTEIERDAALKGAIFPTGLSSGYSKEYDFSHPNFSIETLVSKEKDQGEIKKRFSYYLSSLWSKFDINTLRPWLLYDYPNCMEEHELLSKKIVDVTSELTTAKVIEEIEKHKEPSLHNELSELTSAKIFNQDNN